MELKDYYSILELPPSATLAEIKKAYRRLAHQYHPDKNVNDEYAGVHFTIIKQAYEVLSHPTKKESISSNDGITKSIGKKFSSNEPLTPETILKQCFELNRYVSRLDIHRMNKDGLHEYIDNIFSDTSIEQLNSFNETAVNHQIILSILRTSQYLNATQAKTINEKLFLLAKDEKSNKLITESIHQHKQKENWQKYRMILLLIATIVICLLIYISSL